MNKSNLNRFMLYLYNKQFLPSDANLILKKTRELTQSIEIIIRDCRISTKFIELDISIPKTYEVDKVLNLLKTISSIKEVIEVKERHYTKNEAINNAIVLFNDEKYWWSHEALEMIWKESHGEEKQLLNGLILVCAAFVHYQKDEYNVCLSILERSMIKFSTVKKSIYYGINIDEIKKRITEILQNKEIALFKI
jgi:predicted metal-dependent hydrolase